MDFVDYYKAMGLPITATAKDIKNAYRRLARKFHPDLNPNSKEAKINFQLINEANEVLSDPVKRRKYDKYGKDWQHADDNEKANRQNYKNTGESKKYGFSPESSYTDFFESMFGSAQGEGRGRYIKYRGEDFNVEIQLNLIDAYLTHKQTLSVNGKNIRITIPAGIENGQTIKINGHGGKGINGGPDGDLYIAFSILNHQHLKRLADNLYTSVNLDLYTAVLGGEITVETLTGKVKIFVKPETQNGSTVKLKGKGFPVYKKEGSFGDLFITYSVQIPINLNQKQKNLFTELQKE